MRYGSAGRSAGARPIHRSPKGSDGLGLPDEMVAGRLCATARAVVAYGYFIVARLCQRLLRLSVPPNRVVKWVESIRTMSPAR